MAGITRHQHGAEKSAERGQHRQAPRILGHGQHRPKHHKDDHHPQPDADTDEVVDIHGCKRREIHDARTGALQRQGILPPRVSKVPSNRQ